LPLGSWQRRRRGGRGWRGGTPTPWHVSVTVAISAGCRHWWRRWQGGCCWPAAWRRSIAIGVTRRLGRREGRGVLPCMADGSHLCRCAADHGCASQVILIVIASAATTAPTATTAYGFGALPIGCCRRSRRDCCCLWRSC